MLHLLPLSRTQGTTLTIPSLVHTLSHVSFLCFAPLASYNNTLTERDLRTSFSFFYVISLLLSTYMCVAPQGIVQSTALLTFFLSSAMADGLGLQSRSLKFESLDLHCCGVLWTSPHVEASRFSIIIILLYSHVYYTWCIIWPRAGGRVLRAHVANMAGNTSVSSSSKWDKVSVKSLQLHPKVISALRKGSITCTYMYVGLVSK